MSVTEKRTAVNPMNKKLSIKRQCELIALPRSSFYREPARRENEDNLRFMKLIDEEYTRHPFMGTRQMRDYLIRKKHKVNRKRVRRLMRRMGLRSVAPKPNTSRPSQEHKIYPYLLSDLEIDRSNQVWCSDITYVWMPGGYVYLVAVMDWYSRKVLSWEVSVTMDEDFCISALKSAIQRYGVPDIFNTDQGSQFTGKAFTDELKTRGIRISMDGKGRAMDNIMIERLWRTVKYEEIYLKEYASVLDLIRSLQRYFSYYNNDRSHSSLDKKTPNEIHCSALASAEAA